jgi:probable HAF family extracellular repeat protein
MQTFPILVMAAAILSTPISFAQSQPQSGVQTSIPHVTLTFTRIDCTPTATYTTASGINNAGQVVGDCGGTAGYVWTPNSIHPINFPGATATFAADINSNGEIAGIYDAPDRSGARGFLLDGGVYKIIFDAQGVQTVVNGINAAGDMVGFWDDTAFNIHGFVYRAGVFNDITIPGGNLYTIPSGLNASALVGTYSTAGVIHSFLLQGGVVTILEYPGATYSNAYSINTAGEVIGLYEDSDFRFHGFLWQGGRFIETFDLLAGSMVADIYTRLSLNDVGQIVGTYLDEHGARHGFVANLPRLN